MPFFTWEDLTMESDNGTWEFYSTTQWCSGSMLIFQGVPISLDHQKILAQRFQIVQQQHVDARGTY